MALDPNIFTRKTGEALGAAQAMARERGASRQKFTAHPRRQSVERVLGVQAATDTGLITGDHQQEPHLVQAARPFKRSCNELEVLAPKHVTAVNVDDAIAVEKRSPSEGTAGSVHSGCCSSQRT